MKPMIVFLAAASLFSAARAGDRIEVRSLDGAPSPPAEIAALSWLVGAWEGEGLGGAAAEVIAPPAGGQMMGMFRHMKDEESVNFYEFYVFTEVENTLALKLKHFTPDLIGWEEKEDVVEFPLVAIEGDAVYFDGITFAMTGPDTMEAAVNIEDSANACFRYRRSKP